MKHHAAKHRVTLAVKRPIVIDDLPRTMLDPHLLRHQPQQKIDIETLTQQKGEFALLKRRQQPFCEFFPLDRDNAYGWILRKAAADYWHQYCAREPSQRRGAARAEAKVEGGRNVGNAGEMERLMMMSAGDIQQQLLRCRGGDRFIVGADRAVQRKGGYATGEREQDSAAQ